MKTWVRLVANAVITFGIVFFSSLTITGIPSWENIWASFAGAFLQFLFTLRAIISDSGKNNNPGPPIGVIIW